MRRLRGSAAGLLIGGVLLVAAPRLGADEGSTDPKNELVVFGGGSILSATRGEERILSLPGRLGDRFPGFPDVSIRTETSLGSSALFGARYSRYIKGRLAIDADIAVAPAHDLEAGGDLCLDDRCYGTGGPDRFPAMGDRGLVVGDLFEDDFPSRHVTAWHYGAGLAYDITGGDVRPIVILGGGAVTYSGGRESSTDFVLRFGAGLKVYFGKVGGRVEVVDHLITDHYFTGKTEHDVHVSGGFLVRF